MKRICLIIFWLLFVFINTIAGNISNSSDTLKNSILLDFNFKKSFPFILKVDSAGFIFVSNGKSIYIFNKIGKLIKNNTFSEYIQKNQIFIDFIFEDKKDISYLSLLGSLVLIDNKSNTILLKTKGGEMLKMDNDGNIYTNYQYCCNESNKVVNSIRVIPKNGKAFLYPTNIDFATMNFEVINNEIYLYNEDNKFYIIPTDTTKKTQILNLNINWNNDLIWFLGIVNESYVFKTYDMKRKMDIVYFFNKNYKLIKSYYINFTYSELDRSYLNSELYQDGSLENPSGIYYYYDNDNHIYLMRNTTKGVVISEIRDCLGNVYNFPK